MSQHQSPSAPYRAPYDPPTTNAPSGFAARTMPPPLSPHQPQTTLNTPRQASFGRDLPTPGSRAASMSISAMLDSSEPRHVHTNSAGSPPNTYNPPHRQDYSPQKRPYTPDSYPFSKREGSTSASPQAGFAQSVSSPERYRFSLANQRDQFSDHHVSVPGRPLSEPPGAKDWREREEILQRSAYSSAGSPVQFNGRPNDHDPKDVKIEQEARPWEENRLPGPHALFPGSQPNYPPPPAPTAEPNFERQQYQEPYNYDARSQAPSMPNSRPDEITQARNPQLALGPDSGKRLGRLSPLPQAVQGAQAQIGVLGGEPGIKTEFGRMFSGLGSGVGSTMASSGSAGSAPHSQSPSKNDDNLDRARRREDEGRDSESDKAGRKPHQPHHHRGHRTHHHHHHHKPEDAARQPAYLSGTGPLAAPQHSHHHHHHHHTPKPTTPTTPVVVSKTPLIKKPSLMISSQDALNSITKYPSYHLGSTVYCPTISISPSARYGFASTPKPIPRFLGKENCTFTIRVPRFYLTNENREEIVHRRAIWGSEIYTDDSDIIAASVHDGWIKGVWSDDVDMDALKACSEIEESIYLASNKPKDASSTKNMDYRPKEPINPPEGDAHIKIRILPPLKTYGSSTANGIRSRAWAGVHDGMSFKIESIRWVDDDRKAERGGEARRKRLKADLALRSLKSLDLTSLKGGPIWTAPPKSKAAEITS